MNSKYTVIVDSDPIVYRVGFSMQKPTRHVVFQTCDDDSSIQSIWFEPDDLRTAHQKCEEWKEKTEDIIILDEEEVIAPEPNVEHVMATVRSVLKDIKYAVAENLNVEPSEIVLRCVLTGPGNFREKIATVKEYKGNRKQEKPYWYQQIRNYLTEHWDAQVVHGREADDECSIACKADPERTIIATIDKDLDQVPGWHYNYGTREKSWYRVEPDQGDIFFYKQVLMGDSGDNIPGCYKVGKSIANRVVDTIVVEYGVDHDKLWNTIVELYDKSLEQYGKACPYYNKAHEEGVEAVVIEMARLVKMQDYQGQLWTPHDRPDELLDMEFEE